jgi:dipeptidyl aminopeptidase/acylaminoacyl peptidase
MQLILVRALLALAFASFSSLAAAQAARPPAEAFFDHPSYLQGEISPTGRHVALLVRPKGGRSQLVVMDTATQTAKVVARFSDIDVTTFHWVNDKRLVFTVFDLQGETLAWNVAGPGLLAVDIDGGDMRQLARMGWMTDLVPGSSIRLDPTARYHSSTANRDSEDIFVTQSIVDDATRDLKAVNLLRVNTRTGAVTPFQRPGDARGWVVDTQNVPRIAYALEGARAVIYHQDKGSDSWSKLHEFDAMTGADGWWPVGFAPDGTLFVERRVGAKGHGSLFRYDFAKKAVDPAPVVSVEGFDVHARLIRSGSKLLGIRYESDAPGTAWFDPALKDTQGAIDKLLPGTVNLLNVPVRPEVPVVMVFAFSDTEPGIAALYNTQTGKLTGLGRTMPAIDAKQMAQRDFVRYKARDGLDIPAWITVPKGGKGKKLPMVVLVHGGPWVRGGHWRWNDEAQFLASRGYVVLQPEFRGSQGYGHEHFKAGWKQWGKAMQNDVADGARWAVQQGLADPSRICIAGASYGGYSALMGLVNDPDLFRCGVSWVGVTDIELMYDVHWSDFNEAYKQYGMPALVGDRVKDAEQLKATSPLYQAHRIKQPLLLAYGGRDRRVPIVHGTKFREAVQKTNPNVEWVDYAEEGHGWFLVKNRVDFWTRVEKFLEKNIGK